MYETLIRVGKHSNITMKLHKLKNISFIVKKGKEFENLQQDTSWEFVYITFKRYYMIYLCLLFVCGEERLYKDKFTRYGPSWQT